MQFGLRLHDAKEAVLEERLSIAAKQGFTCAHLALSKTIKEHSIKDSALTPGFAMHLGKQFTKHNLDVAVLGCYLNLANPNQETLKKTINRYKTHIRFASHLGCGVVGTETGCVNEAYEYEPACHTEEALETFINNLKGIVKYAEQMGVIFAIEPVWSHIVYNGVQARKVLDAINSPNLQIIFDPVNLLCYENYENREMIINEAIELLAEDIAVIHLKDFVVEGNNLKSVAAGTGLMNYDNILAFAKKEKPYIHATLENTTPDNAVRAREFLQNIYDSVSV